jgi:hypothetical protein
MYDKYRVNIPFRTQITTKTTTPVVSGTCYISSLMYNCTNAGSAWSMTIQDHTGAVLYTLGTLVLSTVPVVVFDLASPIPFMGGLDIVTGGTTAGSVNVWGNASQR